MRIDRKDILNLLVGFGSLEGIYYGWFFLFKVHSIFSYFAFQLFDVFMTFPMVRAMYFSLRARSSDARKSLVIRDVGLPDFVESSWSFFCGGE